MKRIILFIALFLLFSNLGAQPIIQWQHSMGGTLSDELLSISQTNDGGYIAIGSAGSADGNVFGNHGADDIWIIKFTTTGATQWSKCIGGMSSDQATSIRQTPDGGFIFSGISYSYTDDFLQTYGLGDCWVVKLDTAGSIEWKQHFGGSGLERGSKAIPTADGGYLVFCETQSNDIDAWQNPYADATWIIKLSSIGQMEWQRFYGACKFASDITATSDGCYVIVGTNCDLIDNRGLEDFWVSKIDSGGSVMWEKSFGGTNVDVARVVHETVDRGLLVGGYTRSNDGDVTGNHGWDDSWVIKLNSAGSLRWQKTYGGTLIENIESLDITSDDGFIVAGSGTSSDGDVTGGHGAAGDFWIVKADSNGTLLWENCYGGSNSEIAYAIDQSSDGGFIVAGVSTSNDGDVSGNHNSQDGWVCKLSYYTSVNAIQKSDDIQLFPLPANNILNLTYDPAKTGIIKSANLYNILSHVVIQNLFPIINSTLNSFQFSVAELPSGNYTLFLETAYGNYNRKVIIIK